MLTLEYFISKEFIAPAALILLAFSRIVWRNAMVAVLLLSYVASIGTYAFGVTLPVWLHLAAWVPSLALLCVEVWKGIK